MGSRITEESPAEKNSGDQIHTEGLTASIRGTIDKQLGKVMGKRNIIMNLAENGNEK